MFAFNERAIRAYRKAGFNVEGRAREAIWRDGRFWDELSMSILENEWRASRSGRRGPIGLAGAAGEGVADDELRAADDAPRTGDSREPRVDAARPGR